MTPATNDIIAAARGFVGTPYRHRASTPGAGCDCLGLLRGVWRAIYGAEPASLPNYRADARDPRHTGALLAAAEQFLVRADGAPRAGQVILFRLIPNLPPRHCGIMVGERRFVHAQEGHGVVEASLSDAWQRRVAALFDWPEQ